MNSIKVFNITTRFFFILACYFCQGQILSSSIGNNSEEEDLIAGTWVAEGSTVNDRWVFTDNNILHEYTNGSIETTYNWNVYSSTNSGVTSLYIEIVNVEDSSDTYDYEISVVNQEKLVLIYQRKDNMGIGKPMTYLKQ